jgi:hypothetical protein
MTSFPFMHELPPTLLAEGWTWKSFSTPSFPSQKVWLGTDSLGRVWLTKLSGSYHAYREIVFARIAQQLGWSCQSSVFLRLSKADANAIGAEYGEVHAVHWFLHEHGHPNQCAPGCPLLARLGQSIESVEQSENLEVDHAMDLARGHFASCIFGANEAPQPLITTGHCMVLIDNETMFQSLPCPLDGTVYWGSDAGQRLAHEVCEQIAALPESALRDALEIPAGLKIRRRSEIASRLKVGHSFARHFARDPSSPLPPLAGRRAPPG